MIEKGMNHLTASKLRLILIGSLIATILIAGVGFYFLQSYLNAVAIEVSHANEDASTSDSDITKLQNLEKRLAQDRKTIDRAASIVADSKSYEYQDQIITDINTYASRAGVSVASFSFPTTGISSRAGVPAAGAAATATPPIAGLKSINVSVALVAPVDYNKLMQFVHYVEQNLTKMQIANISLTKGQKADEVTVNTLDIEVYVKDTGKK